MARPCSMDLRMLVIQAAEHDGLSGHQVAARFGIGIVTAIRWLRQYRTTGSVAAGQMGGYQPRRIAGEHHDWLIKRCKAQDFTLRGLVAELAERGLKVDYRSVWRFVHDEKLRYEKKRCSRANKIGPISRAGVRNGGVISIRLIRPDSFLLTRPGRKQTWRLCADGGRGAAVCLRKRPSAIGTPRRSLPSCGTIGLMRRGFWMGR